MADATEKDLTAILLPEGQLPDDQIRQIVFERGQGDCWVRVQPLPSIKLVQVEVHDGEQGLPSEDPELVARLSKGGWAAFVHVNHQAQQAIVHGFNEGAPGPGFAGAPGADFDAKLKEALKAPLTLPEVTAADDGSRIGIGVASTRTVAIVRGQGLGVPPGTPTGFHSFVFHDAGAGLDEEDERLAFFAFDPKFRDMLWGRGGAELAEALDKAPAGFFGPLEPLRASVPAGLSALGAQSPEAASLTDVRALELITLAAARVFAGGDLVSYWDERVLPLFALTGEPVVEPSDVDDLDSCDSVLHALVEVQPFQAPPGGEGSLLACVADNEIAPLAPWAKPGEEYQGAVFRMRGDRLLQQIRSLDGNKLRAMAEKVERAWYRAARPGQPEGDAYESFRRAHAEEGKADTERLLRNWTELRICLELALANRLELAMLFYGA